MDHECRLRLELTSAPDNRMTSDQRHPPPRARTGLLACRGEALNHQGPHAPVNTTKHDDRKQREAWREAHHSVSYRLLLSWNTMCVPPDSAQEVSRRTTRDLLGWSSEVSSIRRRSQNRNKMKLRRNKDEREL